MSFNANALPSLSNGLGVCAKEKNLGISALAEQIYIEVARVEKYPFQK